MAQIENVTFSKVMRLMLSLSLDAWNNILLLSLAAAAMAAVIVGCSTYVIVQLQKHEATDARDAFERYKLSVEGQVAEAKRQGIEAGKSAGDALLRAAALEKQAQELRAANLALQIKVQPRRISGDKSVQMAALLSRFETVPIAIVSRFFDPEGTDFADDLSAVFTKEKWAVVRYENWTQSHKGVFIATVEGTELPAEVEKIIAAALDANNTEHRTITISEADINTVSPSFQPHVLYLLVGAKP
jgi:hypothetical protein